MRGLIRYSCPCAAWMATFLVQANPVHAQSLTPPPLTSEHAMASDIDPQSGFRLPLPRREDLDEAGQKAYDRGTTPGTTIAGLQGPAGVQLYSTRTAPHLAALNRYLRFEAGLGGRLRELAILVTARELDSQFEWAAHEAEAKREGIAPELIDVIRHRRDPAGIDEADRVVIALGREIFGARKVSPETYASTLAQFGRRKLVDLVALMGNYASTAAMLTAFDMQLDPGVEPPLPPL